MNNPGRSWTAQVMAAVGTLLAVAVAGRLAWELLSPLVVPLLVVMVVCAVVLWFTQRLRQ